MCVLEVQQRRIYDEVKEYHRATLLQLKDAEGPGQQGMLVIEVLLRLRQAACQPGLLDAARNGDPGAKPDMMMPRLLELMRVGHKSLVFSRFTSVITLLRGRLAARGIRHANWTARPPPARASWSGSGGTRRSVCSSSA